MKSTIEFCGGPVDGSMYELKSPEPSCIVGKILQFHFAKKWLYESNGPVDALETIIRLSYHGVENPKFRTPGIAVIVHVPKELCQ